MNQPHFLRSGHAQSPRHKRRFRGRLVIDSPPVTEGLPSLIDGLQLPSIDQLRQMMDRQPPMSEERMAEIRRKLASGEYLTRGAAELSADRLLDDAEFRGSFPTENGQAGGHCEFQ